MQGRRLQAEKKLEEQLDSALSVVMEAKSTFIRLPNTSFYVLLQSD